MFLSSESWHVIYKKSCESVMVLYYSGYEHGLTRQSLAIIKKGHRDSVAV